jgi:serine/threonine protein kinase
VDPVSVANIVGAVGIVNGTFDRLQIHSMGGQFSAVFQARHIPTGNICALKFLAHRGDPQRHAAFDREGALLTTVLDGEDRHFVPLVAPPSKLVQTFPLPTGSSVTFDLPYLALEWLPRGTPEQYSTAAVGHAQLLHRLALIKSMTHALSRAHYLRLAHRDVKPSNFLLVSRNAVKLNDFGSALHSSGTLSNYIAPPRGDLRYTAPELLVDAPWPLDIYFGADIYGLGCTAFELITGQPYVAHSVLGSANGVVRFRQLVLQFPHNIRVDKYHDFLGPTNSRFPNLRTINPDLPRCAYPAVIELLESLCHFDYRARERSFVRIHRLLAIATLVVGNELRVVNKTRARKARRQVIP